jgi:hypothetical protein
MKRSGMERGAGGSACAENKRDAARSDAGVHRVWLYPTVRAHRHRTLLNSRPEEGLAALPRGYLNCVAVRSRLGQWSFVVATTWSRAPRLATHLLGEVHLNAQLAS